MKVHVQVDGAPANAARSACDIASTGADGIFTFEGRHDVFFPLVIASAETDLALMTNAEIGDALEGVASLVAFYGSTPAYVPVLQVEGFDHIHSELNALSKSGASAEMRALITDQMVQTIPVVGTPQECAAEIAARFGAYAQHVCCYFPGYLPRTEWVVELIAALHQIPVPA